MQSIELNGMCQLITSWMCKSWAENGNRRNDDHPLLHVGDIDVIQVNIWL